MEINGNMIYPSVSVYGARPESSLVAKVGRTDVIAGGTLVQPFSVNGPSGTADQSIGAKEQRVEQASFGDAALKMMGQKRCQTCANRKYQDVSNDAGVSFQTPTKISPENAPMAVRSHEQEHVNREQVKAQEEGRKIVFQAVRIFTSICPECQRVYVSGGVTETVTSAVEKREPFNTDDSSMIGGRVNTVI